MIEAATLADVAERAGVSIATASRALSGTRKVSRDNAERVARAAKELGYRHNPLAGALRTQRSGAVGVLLPRFSPGFLATLIESISIALDGFDRTLTLRYIDQDAAAAVDGVRALRDRRVDGIILCAPSPDVAVAAVEAARPTPLVLVGRHHDTVDVDSVGLDDERAAELITAHASQHSTQIFVVGFDESLPADRRRRSLLGLAAEQHGMTIQPVPCSTADLDGGVQAAQHLVTMPTWDAASRTGTPTVVCANDDIAHGIRAVLHLHAVSIPEEVQIASLMDVAFSDASDRSITTLRHPWPQMGAEAARMLDETLRSPLATLPRTPRRIAFTPTLLRGQSTRD